MDPAKDTANANSKVLRIERIVEERHRPSVEQMEAIAAVVDEWRTGTGRTPPSNTHGVRSVHRAIPVTDQGATHSSVGHAMAALLGGPYVPATPEAAAIYAEASQVDPWPED